MINKEVIIFQIEDMLSNINKENFLLNGGRIDNGATFLELMTNVLTLLKEQPQIVRCKECKHGRIFNGRNKKIVACENVDYPCFDLDWFCADGERGERDAYDNSKR